jgi:hypothetical protein
MEKQEIWKKILINGQETFYSVSNYGNVRNDSTKTLLGGSVTNNGYRIVHLRYRIDKNCSVHRLVMKAFKPCEEMDELQVNHIDGNKLNNNIDNLEWSTALENMRHSYTSNLQQHEMKECHQYDLSGNYIQSFVNGYEAAQKLNLDYTSIWRCITEQQQHYKQYQFKSYKKDKINCWSNSNKKIVYVYDNNGNFIDSYNSQKECAKAFGVAPSSICRYLKGIRKLKGFVFSDIPL